MVQRLRNKMRIIQSAITHRNGSWGARTTAGPASFVRGSFRFHKMPHKPKRFKLLLVIARWRATAEIFSAISSSCKTRPAGPRPVCNSCNRLVNWPEAVSTFRIARVIAAALLESRSLARRATGDNWLENRFKLLTAVVIGCALAVRSELRLLIAPPA